MNVTNWCPGSTPVCTDRARPRKRAERSSRDIFLASSQRKIWNLRLIKAQNQNHVEDVWLSHANKWHQMKKPPTKPPPCWPEAADASSLAWCAAPPSRAVAAPQRSAKGPVLKMVGRSKLWPWKRKFNLAKACTGFLLPKREIIWRPCRMDNPQIQKSLGIPWSRVCQGKRNTELTSTAYSRAYVSLWSLWR